MDWINHVDDESVTQYLSFTKECKKLVSSLINSSTYSQLRSPNTKGSKDVPISQYKSRINILGRPHELPKSGRRHLEVGGLETVIIVQAPFNDVLDFKKGVDLSKVKGGIRIVVGNQLSTFENLMGYVEKNLRAYHPVLKHDLYEGNYLYFVRTALGIMDKSLLEFKYEKRLIN